MSARDLKSVYAKNNGDEVTFVDKPALVIRFFEIAGGFGGVKDYNGMRIIWQVTSTLNSLYLDWLEQQKYQLSL